ncbi:MAG: hypothetical protein WDA59_07295 [Methanofastidiosum sp.]
MANMSYCRFQNTVTDLMDCLEALNEQEIASEEEQRAADRMLREVAYFLYQHDIVDELPDDVNDRIKELIGMK